MKNRIAKKHSWCMCSHNHSFDDMVTDDPYPMYEHWFVCAVRKDYQDYPEKFPKNYNPCDTCKHKQFSYEEIRNAREAKKENKRYCKYMDKHPEEFEYLKSSSKLDGIFNLLDTECPF